jgi:DNA-binding response OmpR family regulator
VWELVLNKILLLEDDPSLAKSLIKFLSKNGYKIDWAKDGEEASSLSYDENYLLYLFDINVPQYNGDDLLADLRQAEDFTPCILISALVDIESVTKGFRSGADDYIKKPFEPQELLIRIEAKTNQLTNSIRYKDYELVIDEDKILYQNSEIFLSYTLKYILISLIKNYPNPSTKEELMEYLEAQNDLALRVNITKLKKKLNIDIQNIRGIGYKLV